MKRIKKTTVFVLALSLVLGVCAIWALSVLACEGPTCCEGCSPGYWKNHLDVWGPTGHSLDDDFDATFGVDLFEPGITLGEAIRRRGGAENKLARHGTAALLSAAHPDVAYPLSVGEVIGFVQTDAADILEANNELGCPLD